MVNRRRFLKTTGTIGAASLTGLAGCLDDKNNDTDTDGSTTTAEPTTTAQQAFLDNEISFYVSPSNDPETMQNQYQPLQEYLGNKFEASASLTLANNYSEVIQLLGDGTSDIAETGPFAAALAVKADNAEIAVQRKGYGSWDYKSLIVAAPGIDVNNLDEMKTYVENNDTTIAFADRLSASGCLFPLYNLKREANIDIGNLPSGSGSEAAFTPNFSDHTDAFETLKDGQAQFAGIGGFVPNIVDDFDSHATIVHEHTGLPRAPILLSAQLPDREKEALTDSLVTAPDKVYYGADGEEGTDDDPWFDAVRKVGVREYQPVMDAANELGIGADYFDQ